MSKHTPGPLDLIDKLWPHSRDILESQYPAEARLIAAAPELLEALRGMMLNSGAHWLEARRAARAAIARAEGLDTSR